jgi:Methylase involved in ubiquinone/menaquinone biosynthesis
VRYAAREHYTDPMVVQRYETDRYTSPLGRHRWRIEQRAVNQILSCLPPGQRVLDCPVGNGRWARHLLDAGHSVLGVDISVPMLEAAGTRLASTGHRLTGLVRADAERLPVRSGRYDYVFSHALTKHLPPPVQDLVFAEFARVARRGVVCSFSILSGPRGALWRARRIPEGYGRTPGELAELARRNGLSVRAAIRCTTVLGVERTVLFERG